MPSLGVRSSWTLPYEIVQKPSKLTPGIFCLFWPSCWKCIETKNKCRNKRSSYIYCENIGGIGTLRKPFDGNYFEVVHYSGHFCLLFLALSSTPTIGNLVQNVIMSLLISRPMDENLFKLAQTYSY